MPVARSDEGNPSPQAHRPRRLVALAAALRSFARRRRTLLTVVGSLVTAAVLAFVLAGRRDEFTAALGDAAAWVLVVTALLQVVALLVRSEAWHLSIEAAGGTVERRVLYRASSMGVLGSLLNAQMAVAVRIGALRRSSPLVSPQVPTLIAAEFPILAIEATLAAGPSVGAAAAVLILGSHGVAAAAAAGVLLTVTGTVGGLCFLAWAGADRLWSGSRRARFRRL